MKTCTPQGCLKGCHQTLDLRLLEGINYTIAVKTIFDGPFSTPYVVADTLKMSGKAIITDSIGYNANAQILDVYDNVGTRAFPNGYYYYNPPLNTFYGEVEIDTIEQEVDVQMHRMVFGYQVEVQNLTSGALEIDLFHTTNPHPVTVSSDTVIHDNLTHATNWLQKYVVDGGAEARNFWLRYKYTDEFGVDHEDEIFYQNLQFHRLEKKVIIVDMAAYSAPSVSETTSVVSLEEVDITEGEVILVD